jgi:hypothetical protein
MRENKEARKLAPQEQLHLDETKEAGKKRILGRSHIQVESLRGRAPLRP